MSVIADTRTFKQLTAPLRKMGYLRTIETGPIANTEDLNNCIANPR